MITTYAKFSSFCSEIEPGCCCNSSRPWAFETRAIRQKAPRAPTQQSLLGIFVIWILNFHPLRRRRCGLPQDRVTRPLQCFPIDGWAFFLTPGFVLLALLNYIYLLIFQRWAHINMSVFVCFEQICGSVSSHRRNLQTYFFRNTNWARNFAEVIKCELSLQNKLLSCSQIQSNPRKRWIVVDIDLWYKFCPPVGDAWRCVAMRHTPTSLGILIRHKNQ